MRRGEEREGHLDIIRVNDHFNISLDVRAVVVEGDEGVPDQGHDDLLSPSPRDVDPLAGDAVHHLAGQVEDGVLVGLDRLGGVDYEHEWGVEDLALAAALAKAGGGGLGAEHAVTGRQAPAQIHCHIELALHCKESIKREII